MSGDRKPGLPFLNIYEWLFRASLLLLGASIALNVAIAFLVPVLPWLAGVLVLLVISAIVVAVVRWRRSRW